MKIALGCDHAGFEYKETLKSYLLEQGHEVEDFGTYSPDSVDYPDYVHPACNSIESGKNETGILICGSANGVAMAANKHKGIRAAIVWLEELAGLARKHNDANVLCLPARFISYEQARQFSDVFLSSAFEGGRHSQRVNKIAAC